MSTPQPDSPDQGGSYSRDPETGALTLVDATQPAVPRSQQDEPSEPSSQE